jgi:hypothetical protein
MSTWNFNSNSSKPRLFVTKQPSAARVRFTERRWWLAIGKRVENEERTTIGAGAVAEVTYYVALPFVAANEGVAAGEPTECLNPNAAVMRAEALSRREGHFGAVAFSRTGDPATGHFSDAKVITKFGDVPDDLSAL